MTVEKLYEVPNIIGASKTGNCMVVDNHVIPNTTVYDRGDHKEIVLDNRLSYVVPNEWSYLFADAIANAMAIGAGYPHFQHPKRDKFATTTISAEVDI